ncbi:MAG: DNA cytosine methyltransferase [Acidobacteria bacterium]|nr:DNA cytosine methyltransferase [Acidobacteriota bacterium]
MSKLVLSIFPGIDLLGRAFEEAGYCVVRGPDLVWGGDVKSFHPPAGRFDGIIGGPPCQSNSQFAHLVRQNGNRPRFQDLTPEFSRCCAEAQPAWFLAENVRHAPIPDVSGYSVSSALVENRLCGGEQSRCRRISFGVRQPAGPINLLDVIELDALEPSRWVRTVLASGGVRPDFESKRGRLAGKFYGYATKKAVIHALAAQGLPENFFAHSPFRIEEQHRLLGNGVPLHLGRRIAQAVQRAEQVL